MPFAVGAVYTRRVIVDNGHYIRQDTKAFKRLFQLRRVVAHPFAIVVGMRLDKTTTEGAVQSICEQVPGAKETFGIPQTLYPPAEDQLIEPILFELLRGQYAMPADDLIAQVLRLRDDLKRAVARNWVRLDVLAMKVDEKLRKADPGRALRSSQEC